MAIDATLPTLSSPVPPASTGLQPPQAKPAETQGEPTQTEQAVAPADDGDSDFDNSLSAGNKEGRGQLVDVKI